MIRESIPPMTAIDLMMAAVTLVALQMLYVHRRTLAAWARTVPACGIVRSMSKESVFIALDPSTIGSVQAHCP
jgi:hypothetical protein